MFTPIIVLLDGLRTGFLRRCFFHDLKISENPAEAFLCDGQIAALLSWYAAVGTEFSHGIQPAVCAENMPGSQNSSPYHRSSDPAGQVDHHLTS